MKYIFAISLLFCVHTSNGRSYEGKFIPDEIVANPAGKLAIYNSKYVFPVRLFQEDVIGEYLTLHKQFLHLYELISITPSNVTASISSIVSLLLEELQEWKHDYFSSIAKVHNLFNWDIHGNKRSKRGLVDLGGSLLNVLFGTAEQKDITSLNLTLSKVFEHTKSQDMEINLHSQILNVTTRKINRINIVQKKLSNLISELDDKIQSMENITEVVELNQYHSNAFSSLILALMNINQKTASLGEGIIAMIRGTLSPLVIENDTLREFLQIIVEKGHSLIINDNEISLNFYYDITTVNAIFEHQTNSILFLISIPINLHHGEIYNMYKITSLLRSTPVSEVFTAYKVAEYLAIGENGGVMELDSLQGCNHIDKIFVCALQQEVVNQPESSCAFRLLNSLTPYSPICSKSMIKLKRPSFRLLNRIWYYATPEPLELYIHCFTDELSKRTEYVQNITLTGAGSIKIDSGCTATNEKVHLMATSKKFFDDAINISMVEEYLPSITEINKLRNSPLAKKINIDNILDDSNEDNINELTAQMDILYGLDHYYSDDLNYFSILVYTSIVLAFIALIIMLAGVGLMIVTYQHELMQHEEYELPEYGNIVPEVTTIRELEPQQILDISKAYHSMPKRSPLYENDIVMRKHLNSISSESQAMMENDSHSSMYITMDSTTETEV